MPISLTVVCFPMMAHPTVGGPRAVMVYVGQGARTNFETGGRDGWWGWQDPPTGLEALQPGDLIAFGSGFDAGSPRVDTSYLAEPPSR